MADPRKVPFVTLASYSTTPAATESKKRRREDEENEPSPAVATGGVFGAGKPATDPGEPKRTVRLNLSLSEPNEQKSAEFNYGELVHASLQRSGGTAATWYMWELSENSQLTSSNYELYEDVNAFYKLESRNYGNYEAA
ncbi:hypothetical protein DPX16_15101 [Anabarilius grahami]|uniref:Uncharacterized protein n=1 Tax=Anabarilius grahami TaxID=495550 RepID=A0A3N0YX48_ANAGA|nr:hypothetical protein DPX16_15101 [Anabarilius grahami]